MILIIEGSNCVGKTYLAQALERFGYRRYKTFLERKVDRNYSMEVENKIGLTRRIDADLYIFDFLSQINIKEKIIFDRSIISYVVYEKPECYREMLAWWKTKLESMDYLILFLNPGKNALNNFSKNRDEVFIDRSQEFSKVIYENFSKDKVLELDSSLIEDGNWNVRKIYLKTLLG